MKLTVLTFCVLGFVAFSAFATEGIRGSMDPKTVLAEIDQTEFGNSLISMVAVHLATNGPLDEVLVLLNQIRTSLQKQQEEADNNNRTTQAECDTTITSYQKQIASSTSQRAENIKTRDINQAALNIAQKDLTETINALNTNGKRLAGGQAERDSQHNDYAQRVTELETGIKAIDGALQLLQHLQSGSSFVQLKHHFDAVTAELIEASKNSKTGHLYTPLITALADLAEKATPEMIQKILKLFNDLRQSFVKDKQTSTLVENKQMEAWTSLKVDLETEKDQLSEKRSDLERQIEGLTNIINGTNKNIEDLTKQLEKANKNLSHQVSYCNTESENYRKSTAERKRELQIVGKVVEYFGKRAKGATEFIKNRVAAAAL